jgi:hypothetical protein
MGHREGIANFGLRISKLSIRNPHSGIRNFLAFTSYNK